MAVGGLAQAPGRRPPAAKTGEGPRRKAPHPAAQLGAYLADGRAATTSVLFEIVRQVYEALAWLQGAFPGFRHCDLHAGNILVAADPVHTAIIDFGSAGQLASAGGSLPAIDAAFAPAAANVLHLRCLSKGSPRRWLAEFWARISSVCADEYDDPDAHTVVASHV